MARLEAEIAQIAQQLTALPLINSNKLARLKLNDLKRQREEELGTLRRAAKEQGLQRALEEISGELKALDRTPENQARRAELARAQSALTIELEQLRQR